MNDSYLNKQCDEILLKSLEFRNKILNNEQ